MTLTVDRRSPIRGRNNQETEQKKSGLSELLSSVFNPLFWVGVAGLGLAAFAFTALVWATDNVHWDLRKIDFSQALVYQDEKELQQYFNTLKGTNLLTADLETIKNQIEALPWIASASVELEWPGDLQVRVVEETPIAYWNGQDLISQTGKLFSPEEQGLKLPELNGPDDKIKEIMQQYTVFSAEMLKHGMVLASLTLSNDGAYSLTTENGLKLILGREDVQDRFTRTLTVMDRSGEHAGQIAYVDARYKHGVAIGLMPQEQNGEKTDGRS